MDTEVAPDRPDPLGPDARPLRIVVVSEVCFVRECLAEILGRDRSISVVGLCADLTEAVELSPTWQPDVVLLDSALADGIAAVMRVRRVAPDLRIIALAVREKADDIIAWAQAGVIGYVPSNAATADLLRLIGQIHNGEQFCSGRVAAGLLRQLALTARHNNGRSTASPGPALTFREQQAADLIRTGLSDKEIARRLNISLATTKSHVHNLLGKLNVQRRGQVVERLREYERQPSA